MKGKILTIFTLIISLTFAFADNGDTIVVQTIDYDTPLLPGWNNPRSGKYLFPSDTISFSKILMSYNLKCDQGQSPACGEWDYTTHTKVWEHTGVFDSTMHYHPNYIVNNQSPDSFMMMLNPSFRYSPSLEYINQTSPTNIAEPGDGNQVINIPFNTDSKDGRSQFIFTSEELQTAGLLGNDITGLQLNVISGSVNINHLTIRISHFQENVLPEFSYIEDDLELVYERNTTVSTTNDYLPFSFPFSWNGTQNIIIDISYTDHTGSATIEGDLANSNTSIVSNSADYFLNFEGWDYIDVPKEALSTVDSAITISFWQYGNPATQPINSSIFEAVDSLGRRVLNAHLPWSNGKVYWDAGFEDPDRIFRAADAEDYKGQWNFWTFIKDVRSGSMQIFLNGEFWFIGNGRKIPMTNIDKFRIGGAITYDGYYSGMIDDFRIWDTILDWDDIADWMYRDITPDHPSYDHLVAYYKFDDGEGYNTEDNSPNNYTGTQFGYPEWKDYNGFARFKNSNENTIRTHLTLENGDYNLALLDSIVVVDTSEIAPVNVVTFDPDNPPVPLDTLIRWPSYYNNYVYDDGGNSIDSTLVIPDETIYLVEMSYYGAPFEILNAWEIGRFITPYGNGLTLGNDGFTWVYDVTDYRHLLSDSVHITAGNFQELLDLEFHMIEGTPTREVLKVDKIYSGYWYLENFENDVPPDTIELLPNAESFKIKTRTTGHLFDNPTNCAEFCEKIQSVDVNEQLVKEWQILQECSNNPLYPQGGTWIYDRAGWCPGMDVTEQDIEITPYITGDTAIIDYNTEFDQYGTYVLEVHLISYGPYNFNLDAAVEEVVAPNKLKRYGRYNPSAAAPIIVISNQGSETITSLEILHGPAGVEITYNWNGELEFGEKEEVILEHFDWEQWVIGDGKYSVKLLNPNNQTDENQVNNNYYSEYNLPPVYPSTIVQHYKTNKLSYEDSWDFRNNNGDIILEKDNFENETIYIDTITFMNGCYQFNLLDTGNDGISFWANTAQGSGTLRWYDLEGNILKIFNGDFGDKIYHSFYTDMYLGLENNTSDDIAFNIIPVPNDGNFTINYVSKNNSKVVCSVYNSIGQLITAHTEENTSNNLINISLENIPNGVYTCVISSGNSLVSKKFVVSK